MSSDRSLQLFVRTWDSYTFADAVPALSEAGFVPEVLWEATVREAQRLTGRDEEGGLPMSNDGIEAWFSLERRRNSWVVDLSLKIAWFKQHDADWRPRFAAIASAFHATTVIVNRGEAGDDVIDVTEDRDLARLLARESIAEVWVSKQELAATPFQVLGGYRLFRYESGA